MQFARPDIRSALTGAFAVPAVLPSYRRARSPAERIVKHGAFMGLCIALGLAYGFLYTLLPPFLLVYLALPIAALAVIVIWALPDTARAPVKLLKRLFFALIVILALWPNYLAIQLPGLPWMTLRRLVTIPLVITLLICVSTSSQFRRQLSESLSSVRPLAMMFAGFVFIQFITLFWSASAIWSINQVLNYWVFWASGLFAAAWALTLPGSINRFVNVLIVLALLLSVVAAAEYANGQVLWAGHIPSFLQVQDEIAKMYVEAQVRDAAYRVVTTFTVSLAFAEFLAIVTPFVLHRLMNSKALLPIVLWSLADLAMLAAILSSQSRLGIVGWLTAHVAYICLWAFRRWRSDRADLIAPTISLVYPVGAILFVIGMFTVPAIRNRTIGGGSTSYSDQARADQFAMMWPKLFDNPFGYGAGRAGEVLGYRLPSGLLTVDSYIITIVLDYGIIGLGLFAGMLLYATAKMFKLAWRNPTGELSVALPLACALTVVIQVRLVLSQPDNIPLIFVLLGMVAAVAWRAKRQEIAAEPGPTG